MSRLVKPIHLEPVRAFHQAYPAILELALERGVTVRPRGHWTKELAPFSFVLTNPADSIRLQRVRRLNYAYAIIEKLSLVEGIADPAMFCFYIPWLRAILQDDGTFGGAYGPRVSRQLPYVLNTLRSDPATRQAVITVFSPTLDHLDSRDVPCTLSLQFLIRSKRLDLVVTMRSSDLYLGLPYDVQQFTFLQQLMARWLDVPVGKYYHQTGSAHVYRRDFAKARSVIELRAVLNERSEPPVDLSFADAAPGIEKFFQAERLLRAAIGGGQVRYPGQSNYLAALFDAVTTYVSRRKPEQLVLPMAS